LEHAQIHDTGNGRLHEGEGAVYSLLRAQNTFTFGLSAIYSKETRIFAAPDPAVVVMDLTTAMKRSLITENYGVQKSLIVLYVKKHLHSHNYPM
jgi:hypothetical protein